MAAKRLSSLFSINSDRSDRPAMPRNNSSPALSREPSPPDNPRARSRSPGPGKLQKVQPNHPRAPSGPFLDPSQPTLQDLQQQYAGGNDDAPPVLPPPTFGGQNFSRPSSRDGSRPNTASGSMIGGPGGSRPSTPTLILPGSRVDSRPPSPNKTEKRKSSWFGSNKKKSADEPRGPMAWIAGHPQRLPFDAEGLLNGQKVPELWDDMDGNCYVHLFPKDSGKGPSFKIDSAILPRLS
jgi:hypothetical protein